MHVRPIVLLLLLTAAPARGLSVRLFTSVGAEAPRPGDRFVRQGTEVVLHAVVAGERAERVRWFRIEPVDPWVSNTDPTWHWADIDHVDDPIAACDDRLTCAADRRLGTTAYRVEVHAGGVVTSSPGAEELFRGGLRPEVLRVTVRRDDTYLGLLTELFGTPYIWGSAGKPDARHQTERRIGSDCADFVTYGVRRLGFDVPYTSTLELHRFTRELFSLKPPGSDGVYRRAGTPVPVGPLGVKPGDLLLFPGHVGAFAEDRPPLGVLSTSDVMMHTCFAPPAEQPLRDTEWAARPVKVLRWRVLERSTSSR